MNLSLDCLSDQTTNNLSNWKSRSYLESRLDSVTIAVTPNGLADAVVKEYFMLPYETQMPVSEFLDRMQPVDPVDSPPDPFSWKRGSVPTHPPAYYIQSQNNNLHGEFKALLNDIPQDIPFATEALGKKPDAVNFWLGNSRSVTSFHRDHYENIYHVVAGTKRFILYVSCKLSID